MTITETVEVNTVDDSAVDTIVLDPAQKKPRMDEPELDGVICDNVEEDDEIEDGSDESSSNDQELAEHGMVILPMPREEGECDNSEGDSTGATPDPERTGVEDEKTESCHVGDMCEEPKASIIEINDDETDEDVAQNESAIGSSDVQQDPIGDI